jgi:hypothetical protein
VTGLCALQAISTGKKKPHEGEEAPGEGSKEEREGREGREKRRKSAPSLNNAFGTDAEAQHKKCTSTCEGRPTPTPLVKEGKGRQGLDPGIIMPWPPRLASHNRKKGDGQGTPCLLQGKGLSLAQLPGEEGQGERAQAQCRMRGAGNKMGAA